MASTIASDSDQTGHELKLCGACTRDNQTISATKWCRDCREGLCQPCFISHIKIKATAKHSTIPIEDVTEQEFVAGRLDIYLFCQVHENEPLKLYCKTHTSFCCTLCPFSSHADCKSLIPLEDLSKACADQKLLQKQTTAFIETRDKVQEVINKKSTCIQALGHDKSSIISQASDILKKTKDNLDQLYADFERKVIREHEQIRGSQEKMMTILLDFQAKVECSTTTMQTLRHVTPVESLVMMETLKADLVKHYESVEEKLKIDSNIHTSFKLDTSLKTLVDNLSSMGHIVKESYGTESSEDVFSINKIKSGLGIGMMIGTPAQYPVLPSKDLMTATVKLVKVITCEDLKLSYPWFTDGKFMDDGHLLLAEYHTKNVLLLNEDMKVMRRTEVHGQPTSMDLSNDGKIATIVCDENSVQHYSLPGGQEAKSRMKVERGAWSVAVMGDSTIIGHKNGKVAIYNNKGKVIKSTTTTTSDYSYIAVSNNYKQFFYCDKDSVVACDRQFNVIWRYECDNLRCPGGICVDLCDNVYVVGCESDNVHQISGDGTRHRVLLKQMNKMQSPQAIVFHRTKDMFVVTSGSWAWAHGQM